MAEAPSSRVCTPHLQWKGHVVHVRVSTPSFCDNNVSYSIVECLEDWPIKHFWVCWRSNEEPVTVRKEDPRKVLQSGLTQSNIRGNSSKISSNPSICICPRFALAISRKLPMYHFLGRLSFCWSCCWRRNAQLRRPHYQIST